MSDGPKEGKWPAAAPSSASPQAMAPVRIDLPPGLLAVLREAKDVEGRTKLTQLFVAADRAIHALRDIDLRSYEPKGDESADLSAWEELAPIIGATISEVNSLLATVSDRFPETGDEFSDLDDLDMFGGAFGDESAAEEEEPAAPKDDPESKMKDAVDAIHGIASVLRMEVAAFGQTMRKPQVMADRWNFIDALEAFRGKFRAGVGEMVFSAASALADVRKEDVVPEYRKDIDKSVGLRRALALLGPSVAKENTAAHEADDGDGYTVRRHAGRVVKLLERFVSSRAWKALRAADRQSVTKLMRVLERQIPDQNVFPSEIKKTLEGLDRFLESMAVINHREVLIVHDRGALPLFAEKLRASLDAASSDGDEAARLRFADAMEIGWRLVGRDPELDDALIRAKRVEVDDLDSEDIAFWSESMLERLSVVPIP